jgi:hypothetical protein
MYMYTYLYIGVYQGHGGPLSTGLDTDKHGMYLTVSELQLYVCNRQF